MGIDNLGLRRGRVGDDIRSSRGPGGIRGPPPMSKFRRGLGARLPPDVCNNCRRPGHYARDCTNVTLCNNCGLPGHATTSCTNERACWNCKETGHNASTCSNQGVCRLCSKPGHMAKDCDSKDRIDTRLCKNCHRPGHLGAECKYEKACNNCRKPGHLARECRNTPVCNICNQKGHIARECGPPRLSIRSLAPQPYSMDLPHYSRDYDRLGHLTRECMVAAICETCGGRGHMAIECPSDPLVFRGMGYRH